MMMVLQMEDSTGWVVVGDLRVVSQERPRDGSQDSLLSEFSRAMQQSEQLGSRNGMEWNVTLLQSRLHRDL